MKKFIPDSVVPIITMFFLFLIASVLNISLPVRMSTSMQTSELSVSGEGKVDIVPNTAYVDVGIRAVNMQTVDAAQKKITEVNNAIIEAMKALGIEKGNIKTSNYSVYPAYDYSSGREIATGFTGSVTLSIKTDNVDTIGAVIEAATKAGANEIQNTRFEVDDPAKYRSEARSKAIENAKAEAKKLADDLGIKLGRVVNVVEHSSTGGNMPYPIAEAKLGLGGGGGASFEPGSQTITSVVTLYFEKR